MSAQRKIYHLLASEGKNESFFYKPELRAPFNLDEPLLVTDKVDGTTMQSQNGEPWKRFDLFSKGDPRKRQVSEKERYELRICRPDDPSVKWYLAAFNEFHARFEEFGKRFPGFWAHFEALGASIGGRYPGLYQTIRVFDVSKDGNYLPFLEAVKMAESAGLPVVPHRLEVFGNLETLLEVLSKDVSGDRELPPHKLEGWILRQVIDGKEVVAKIRISDLNQIFSPDKELFVKRQKITAEELVQKITTEPGWICTGGEEIGAVSHDEPNISDVRVSGNNVVFTVQDRTAMVNGDDIVLVEPWMIQVYQNYRRREQAPRKEGGAWLEVVIPEAAVRLRNQKIQRVVVKKRLAARRAWLDQQT